MRSKYNWLLSILLVFIVQVGYAQEKTLSGVVQEGGLTLPGVSVVIEGTQFGTQTDLDGKYSLKVKQGQTLVFSFIGMQDVKYKVGAATTYNVDMAADGEQLEEVVVLAYGQSKAKNEITGNVVAVKGDVIGKTPVASVDQALQGRVAGLQIASTSGSPGAVQNIRIRGRNSMSATNEPLYVVDGMPIITDNMSGAVDSNGNATGTSLSALAGINSDDIETMTVLKDAAATAAYGARGGNGVILITTKKGKRGEPAYTFKSTVGFQNFARKGPQFLSGEQKKELWLEANINTYGEEYNLDRNNVWDWYVGPDGYGNDALARWVNNGSIENDWRKAVKNKDALMTSISFGVNGGDEKGTYYASLGHDKYEGVVIGSDFRKITGSFNMTRNLNEKLDITIGANVSNIAQNGIMEGGAYFSNPNLTGMFMSPWTAIYNEDGTPNLNTSAGLHNTLYTSANNTTLNDITRVISSNALGYKILDNLKFESNIGLDYTLANFRLYYNPIHGDGRAYGGSASQDEKRIFNYVWQNSLDYRFYLGESHRFNVKAVTEYQKNKFNSLEGRGEVLPPGMTGLGTAAANYTTYSSYYDWAQFSYFGMLNYDYQNRYLLDVTFRREGSSRFSEDQRWGSFYAVGGAWNISSETFMQNAMAINLLRLRGSYGTTGNSSINPNMYMQLLNAGAYNNESAIVAYQYGGPLGWEKQEKFDLGLEFGLFDNRLSGSFTYFQGKSKDLLYSRPLSMTSGYTSQWTNIGDMKNTGIEAELNVDVVRSKDFNWSVGANVGTVKNVVTKMPIVDGEPLQVIGGYNATMEGKAYGTWYLKEYAGVDAQTGNALWYKADGTTTANYNEAERRFQDTSALPKVTGGFNTHVDYKGFYLDALFSFALGYSVYDGWASYTNTVNSRSLYTYNGTTDLMDRWQNPGDITDVPKVSTGGNASYTSPSTRWLYSGDHIRLRQLTFGYNLNKQATRFVGVDAVNFSVSAMNPLTWVKDSRLKWDPEVDATGYVEMATPPLKSVVFTLNVKF
ncbi:SusC/RagA family TonB-linked outer membrane protein [Myroides pelagicus]|uniref:SusC/RagA family TonB-linked outer membrane protein n=1 Tax=Myroides pelagicus TaxID=270914 RepID=A0A7K1GK73_9FLAO|nr:SusC/RagA family TonB-linked outer membrane protein [Myroides pelagicus]MEC4113719.1 SusC/RagA family TonB-linked outer membrane protein [Myroides pelagicus]MTH28823.1 SusC/RagA family TonB-linked outer membrane protein [Myroides pelagicus]